VVALAVGWWFDHHPMQPKKPERFSVSVIKDGTMLEFSDSETGSKVYMPTSALSPHPPGGLSGVNEKYK